MSKVLNFNGYDCNLVFGQYGNGQTAIQLIDTSDGGIVAVASVSIDTNPKIKDDQVIIKNWSENEGVLDMLIDSGIISSPIDTIPTGFVEGHLCNLLVSKD